MQIVNSPYKTTQSWASQGAIINYGKADIEAGPIPLMVAGLSLTYDQQASPLYPLNTDGNGNATKINIKGAPRGTLQLQSIYCPVPKNIEDFLEKASRDCVAAGDEMFITIRPFGDIKCAAGTNVTGDDVFKLKGVELVSLGLNIQSGEITLVNMPLSFTFTTLELNKKTANS